VILKLSGHIGSTASALVDGQLSSQEEERAWSHVLTCPGCRRLVEREGWIKRQVSTLADPSKAASISLMGSLYDVDAWSAVDAIERRSTRRRAAIAFVGAGSVGVAVLGLVALTPSPAGRGEIPGTPSPALIRPGLVDSNLIPAGFATPVRLAPLRRNAK
jgi:anti-sigma factor RsiW